MKHPVARSWAPPAPPSWPPAWPTIAALAQAGTGQDRHEHAPDRRPGRGRQAALVGLRMWVDDVNAKGGLLGRKVEFTAYDDQSNPANTPGIYTKLLDVDKVDLLIAPYATVPTAPIMPLVKQRGKLLMGNFSFQVNAKIKHDMWFNNAPWNDADGWSDGFIAIGRTAGANRSRCWPPTRSSPRRWPMAPVR
jgi:hypothetical protein